MKKLIEENGTMSIRISALVYKKILENSERDSYGRTLESMSEVLERLLGEKK